MRFVSKFFIIYLTLNLFWVNSYATDLNGVVTNNTLKVADSPFVVVGNISVPSWHTLTIEPGVVIKFNTGLNFTINGALNAIGAEGDSIQFTSNDSTPNSGDWNGISFSSTGSGTIEYAIVEYSASGVITSNSSPNISKSHFQNNNNGIDCLSSSSPKIEQNLFQNNGNTAIRCTDSSPTIAQNAIINNLAVSATILCDNSSPTIQENIFYNNGNTGIDCIHSSGPNIWQNTIVFNNVGMTINDDSSPSVKSNIISNNNIFGIAINDAEAAPLISYNDVWSNTTGNYFGTAAEIGNLTTTNANGDGSDVTFNISLDPEFLNPGAKNFILQVTSPCIDAGDPTNPAGITEQGSAADMGALEFDDGILPVELTSFLFSDGGLKWTTASETNNFGFEIQRSVHKNGRFNRVGFVEGAGTTTTPKQYEFRDNVDSGNYYYRLKQIDTDGSFEFSAVIGASYSNPSKFVLLRNYPNPFNPATTISFEIPESALLAENDRVKLFIFNIKGQEVIELLNEKKRPGAYQLQWNGVDKLGRQVASGMYSYRLQFGRTAVTRSMLLLR